MIHSIRGFRDILPPASEAYAGMEALARRLFNLYSYNEIRLPTLEMRELFVKSTGETTDIVEKEMYSFSDAGGREIALRPEGTPGAVRAYIENSMHQTGGNAKLFYIGNMFRAERPQAGRFREFEQIGVECIGNPHPAADAESISLLLDFLGKGGIKDYTAEINSLGCHDCRAGYRQDLLAYLKGHSGELCENCRKRIEKNPLRTLDCKIDGPRLVADAPKQELCRECSSHFSCVQELLASAGRPFRVNRNLVRGLDYYTRTVFEAKCSSLGSQDALAGGGRYDELVKSMGGPDVPAVGWALGVDRTLQAVSDGSRPGSRTKTFVISAGASADAAAFKVLNALRSAGISADGTMFGQSLKSQMRMANKAGALYALMIGEEELRTSVCALKNLETGEQKNIPIGAVAEELKSLKG